MFNVGVLQEKSVVTFKSESAFRTTTPYPISPMLGSYCLQLKTQQWRESVLQLVYQSFCGDGCSVRTGLEG